jgi:hypothetical protein
MIPAYWSGLFNLPADGENRGLKITFPPVITTGSVAPTRDKVALSGLPDVIFPLKAFETANDRAATV